jgi:hypothetical protein
LTQCRGNPCGCPKYVTASVFPVVAFLKPLHIEFMEFFLIEIRKSFSQTVDEQFGAKLG